MSADVAGASTTAVVRRRATASWTLRGLLAKICALAAVLAVVVTTFGIVMLERSKSSLHFRQRVLVPASVDAQTLYRAMLNQETGARGYTITGDPAFLAPFDQGRSAATLLRADMRRLLEHDRDLTAQLDSIDEAIDVWTSLAGQRQVDLVAQGHQDQAIALVKAGVGKQLFDDLRIKLERIIDDLNRRRIESAVEVDRRVTWLGAVTVVGALVAFVASAGIWWLLRRSVIEPLDRLRHETSSVAGGALDTTISGGGPAEVDELGASVDDMRTMLLGEIQAAFSNGVIDAEEAERTRLANDLHDDPIQRLTALQWKLELALSSDDGDVRGAARSAIAGLGEVQLCLRNLMFQLHPPAIDTDGLEVALEDLLAETFEGTAIVCDLRCDDTAGVASATLAMAYRFIAEALRNTRKHAQATRVMVEVRVDEGLSATVVDDGVGFDTGDSRTGDHRGLVIGPQLAHALGGWWRVDSTRRAMATVGSGRSPSGTTVSFWLPVAAAPRRAQTGSV